MEKMNYVFLAEGFEEIEALTVVDVLVRAQIPVTTVAVGGKLEVAGAHDIVVKAQALLEDLDFAGAGTLICPGGLPGASNLAEDDSLTSALTEHASRGGHIAAICAAPAVVLAPLGLVTDRRATCYPGFEEELVGTYYKGASQAVDARVVVDGPVITSNGPASAIEFALAIVEDIKDAATADTIAAGMLYTR